MDIFELCEELGAKEFDGAMVGAAWGGNIDILELCLDLGATDFDGAMVVAATCGHIEIVELCIEYGAEDVGEAAFCAARNGHLGIIKLCKGWVGYNAIHEEVLPIAWHPNRVIDWCFDEEEKKSLVEMWGKKV